MIRDPKLALAVLAGLAVILVALRDVLPPKWVKPTATLAASVGGIVQAVWTGVPLDVALEHVAMMAIAGLAAGGLVPVRAAPAVELATYRTHPTTAADPAPPTPRNVAPPPLPVLMFAVVLVLAVPVLFAIEACTQAEQRAAAKAAPVQRAAAKAAPVVAAACAEGLTP
jgi:hypothetical protein